MNSAFEREIIYVVGNIIKGGTAEEAASLMEVLRGQARRIDRCLANPNHKWNSD